MPREASVTLEHVERFAAPADAVWPFFRWDNLGAMRAGGFFVAVDYDEHRPIPGATRVVTLGDGARLVERLEHEDSAARRLAYAMLDTGGVPIADYRGAVRVDADGSGACVVTFACTGVPTGITAEAWRAMWTGMQVANASFIRTQVGPIA